MGAVLFSNNAFQQSLETLEKINSKTHFYDRVIFETVWIEPSGIYVWGFQKLSI